MSGRRNSYGYSEYRGRGGGRTRTVLLFIIALLAVLLVAGVAVMTFMSQYLEYTPNGVIVHWPWATEDSTPPPIASDPLEVDTDPVGITVEPTLEVEPPQETTPPPTPYASIHAVTVTTAQLRGGSAAQVVLSSGGDALVVEMKNSYGDLAWQSQVPLAATLGTNASDNLTAQAVRALADSGELYLVARVQCFRDPVLARNWMGSIMTRGGNVWYDVQGLGWTSPASQEATDYLSALCLELADMGFDEILLDSAGYPDAGEVNVLAVSDNRPEDLSAPVTAFWQRLSEELAAKDTALAVQTTEDALRGTNTLSGVTAGGLAQCAARVWLPAPTMGTDYAAILASAGFDDTEARLVYPGRTAGSRYQ